MWAYFVGLWAVMSTLMISTIFSDIVRGLLIHGKVRQDTQFRSGIVGFLMRIEMKKSGWIYFYLAGALYNLGVAAALVVAPHHTIVQQSLRTLQSSTEDASTTTMIMIRPEAIAVIALLGVQDTRRFLESVLITEFGNAKMHVALLVAGLIHYLGIAPSVLAAPQSLSIDALPLSFSVHPVFLIAGMALFVFGSYQQYLCNKMLAQQKRESGGKHVVPKGGWFDYVLCPLYSAELLIYLAFAVICGLTNPMANLVLFWVVLNQSICALYGMRWYHEKFRGEKLAKWTLVPGVW